MKRFIARTNCSSGQYVGIALMVAGVLVAAGLSHLSHLEMSKSTSALMNATSQSTSLTQLQTRTKASSQNMAHAVNLSLWSRYGYWIFLAGIGVFAVAERMHHDEIVAHTSGN